MLVPGYAASRPTERQAAWLDAVATSFREETYAGGMPSVLKAIANEVHHLRDVANDVRRYARTRLRTRQPQPASSPPGLPPILYKYVGAKPHHLAILRDLRIRFTQPDELNDPFDCIPGITPPRDVARFVDDTFARNQAEIQRRGIAPGQVAAARAEMIASYTNNPRDLVRRCFTIVRRNMNELGVLSLSTRNDNMALWAHYAETHRGFVIGLRTSGEPLMKRPGEVAGEGEVLRVVYDAGRPIVPCDPLVLPSDLLVRKERPWSYEEEWRVVRRLAACDHSLPPPPASPNVFLCDVDPATFVRVDIGMDAERATIDAIRAAAAPGSRLHHVEVFQAQMDAGRTRIEFERIP